MSAFFTLRQPRTATKGLCNLSRVPRSAASAACETKLSAVAVRALPKIGRVCLDRGVRMAVWASPTNVAAICRAASSSN